MKIRYISLIALVLSAVSFGLAQKKAAPLAPDAVVRNLYAAQKGNSNPFFQKKSRALVDKFFTKALADLIWKDITTTPVGEVGALDFDPLYDAQDVRITQFKIGKPEYGEGNSEVADIPVKFKNMGKGETVLFRLERDSRKIWKISEISYPQREEANTLTKILAYDPNND